MKPFGIKPSCDNCTYDSKNNRFWVDNEYCSIKLRENMTDIYTMELCKYWEISSYHIPNFFYLHRKLDLEYLYISYMNHAYKDVDGFSSNNSDSESEYELAVREIGTHICMENKTDELISFSHSLKLIKEEVNRICNSFPAIAYIQDIEYFTRSGDNGIRLFDVIPLKEMTNYEKPIIQNDGRN